jgi:glycosyltransferase involved in cell wall biosynthesis
MNNLCPEFVMVPWHEVRKYTIGFYVKLLFQLFSRYPVNVLNDYSKGLENRIKELLRKEKYDLLICDFLQSSLNFKHINGYPNILFQHNVESMIARRHVENANNLLVRLFWWFQWKKVFYYEKNACKSFDSVIAVSEEDKKILSKLYGVKNVESIPTGVDVDYFTPQHNYNISPVNSSLVFCGSMDWLPNEDAMLFFIQDILPKVKEEIPNTNLTIVGRNPSPRLLKVLKDYPEIKLTEWVEDVRPFIAKSALCIVPIRIGGGTRLKIYEAMAMEKTVLSTSVGAEGLPVRNGENIVIVDGADQFAAEIIRLLQDNDERAGIGRAARKFVCGNFRWNKVAMQFGNICKEVVERSKSQFKHE